MVKGIINSLIVSLFVITHPLNSHAVIIAGWSFDSSPPDAAFATGTLSPETGVGTAFAIGGTVTVIHPGSESTADPNDASWGLYNFPRQGTGNKTAGAEFRLSTLGYGNLTIRLRARAHPNASRYAQVQCSVDGSSFIDLGRIDLALGNPFQQLNYPLSDLPATENNTTFALRVVSEFDDAELGTGGTGYATAGEATAYSPLGLILLDDISVSGDPLAPSNSAPVVGLIEDLTVPENQPIGPVGFTVNDAEDPADDLIVRASSSNPQLLPLEGIQIAGTGRDRALTLTPRPDAIGVTTIHVTAFDPLGRYSTESFVLSVMSANTPPSVSMVEPQIMAADETSESVSVTVDDEETPADQLYISATSSNPRLVRSVDWEGTGKDRTARITPVPGEAGVTVITVRVTDGRDLAETRFPLVVTNASGLLLNESFHYPDGDIVGGSLRWAPHSGTTALDIASEEAHLTDSRSQDVHLDFAGGPQDSGVVYAGLTVTVSELPSLAGSYFAHFNSSAFRGRIFVHTANAETGLFRFGISNASGTRGEWPDDLSLNTPYRVVARFDVESGLSALWVNPVSESDPFTAALDAPAPAALDSFALRQSSGIGSLTVDELKVATTFEAVVAEAPAMLTIRPDADRQLRLSWPAGHVRYALQSSPNANQRNWTNVPDLPVEEAGDWVVRLPNVGEPVLFRLQQL